MPTTAKKPTVKKPTVKKTPKAKVEREVVHEYPYTDLFLTYPIKIDGKNVDANPFDADAAKLILGWEEESDAVKFGSDFHCKTRGGKKVRLTKNTGNRPFYTAVAEQYMQDMLNGKWKYNAESIIVGEFDDVLSGQHRGVALVWAQEELDGPDGGQWKKAWPDGRVLIDTSVAFGVKQDDETVNSLDTGKPRSLADVLYRSEHFARFDPADRRTAARMCDAAIKLVWHRTGAMMNAFAPRRTHAEALDFLDRHPTLVKVVKHVMEEKKGCNERLKSASEDDKSGGLGMYLSPGYLSGLTYLMAMSGSDGDVYRAKFPRSEKKGNLDRLDKAEEFVVLLAQGSPEMSGVREAIADLGEEASAREREAVLCNAWNEFVGGGKLTAKNVMPDYSTDPDTGMRGLSQVPTVGGIDVGDPKEPDEDDEAEEVVEEATDDTPEPEPEDGDPTPDEVEAGKAEAKTKAKGKT